MSLTITSAARPAPPPALSAPRAGLQFRETDAICIDANAEAVEYAQAMKPAANVQHSALLILAQSQADRARNLPNAAFVAHSYKVNSYLFRHAGSTAQI